MFQRLISLRNWSSDSKRIGKATCVVFWRVCVHTVHHRLLSRYLVLFTLLNFLKKNQSKTYHPTLQKKNFEFLAFSSYFWRPFFLSFLRFKTIYFTYVNHVTLCIFKCLSLPVDWRSACIWLESRYVLLPGSG